MNKEKRQQSKQNKYIGQQEYDACGNTIYTCVCTWDKNRIKECQGNWTLLKSDFKSKWLDFMVWCII